MGRAVGDCVSVGIGVSVGSGVNVSDGIGEAVSVGLGGKVSVKGMLVDEEAGVGEEEAGACPVPVLLKLQASVVRIKMMGRKSFLVFIT